MTMPTGSVLEALLNYRCLHIPDTQWVVPMLPALEGRVYVVHKNAISLMTD